jgi:hypothetical protein
LLNTIVKAPELQCTIVKKQAQQIIIAKPFDFSNATTVMFSVKTSHEVNFKERRF